jgi:hypothetical protein
VSFQFKVKNGQLLPVPNGVSVIAVHPCAGGLAGPRSNDCYPGGVR